MSLPRWTYYSSIFLTAVLTFDYLFGRFGRQILVSTCGENGSVQKSTERAERGDQDRCIFAIASAHAAPNGSPINVLIWAWTFSHTWPVSRSNHVSFIAWSWWWLGSHSDYRRKYGRIICADCSLVPTRRSFAQHFARISWAPTIHGWASA